MTNWPPLAVTAIGIWGHTPVRVTGVLVRRWVTLKLDFRLKSSPTFPANIYGPLIGERLYYNFACERFRTNKLCSRLYSIEIEFY